MPKRVIVRSLVDYSTDGDVTPLQITWPDGRVFPIDKILEVRQAADIACGGSGIRYLCRIAGREVPLWFGYLPEIRKDGWWVDGE